MEEQTLALNFEGIEELQESFQELVKKYPDRAGEILQENAKKLRKEAAQDMREHKKSKKESKKSLTKPGSYGISPIKRFGENQYIEIKAKSPHFHLVEHGHVLHPRGGRAAGFVQGKHMMENAVKRYEGNAVKKTKEMVDALLKEAGLI